MFLSRRVHTTTLASLVICLSSPYQIMRSLAMTINDIPTTNPIHHATDAEWGSLTLTNNQDQLPEKDDETNIQDIGNAVAIIGGGIAGLALAAGLTTLQIPYIIYERAPQIRSQSQGMLALKGFGRRAIESIDANLAALLGKDEELGGVEFATIQVRNINPDGSVSTTEILNRKELDVERSGLTSIVMKWNVLQSLLASTVPLECIKTGYSLVSYQEDDESSSVIITFANGKKVQCKALLACDGTFSRVRKQMYDPETANDPVINFNAINWSSILPQTELESPLSHTVTANQNIHLEPRLGTFLNQCGHNEAFWQIRILDPSIGVSLSGNNGRGGLGLPGAKEKLLSVLGTPGLEDIRAAVARTPEGDIFERCILARNPTPGPWSGVKVGGCLGRVSLIGDAAHSMNPTLGLGANTALEGVACLVNAVRDELKLKLDSSESDDTNRITKNTINWKQVLEAYEAKHRTRADVIQRYSNFVGSYINDPKSMEAILGQEDRAQINKWLDQAVANTGEFLKHVVQVLNDIDVFEKDDVSAVLY